MSKENIDYLVLKLSEHNIGFNDFQLAVMFLTIVAAGISAYFGAYLKKRGEMKAIDEGFENLHSQLKENTKAIEEIKSEFDYGSFIKKQKYEAFFNKQIQCMEQLYLFLVKIKSLAENCVYYSQAGSKNDQSYKDHHEALTEFVNFSVQNRVWLPDDLYKEVEEIVRVLDTGAWKTFLHKTTKEVTQIDFEKLFEMENKIRDEFKNKVPSAIDSVVSKIRSYYE